MTPEQQALATRLLAAAEEMKNSTSVEVPLASERSIDLLCKMSEAESELEAHLATPFPSEDRYGRWRRAWNRKAKALNDDVKHYQKLYDEERKSVK